MVKCERPRSELGWVLISSSWGTHHNAARFWKETRVLGSDETCGWTRKGFVVQGRISSNKFLILASHIFGCSIECGRLNAFST